MVQKRNIKPAPPRYRPSFTLVELLVAIAIMGVLVGMVLFSLAGAQADAKISLTRKTVEKLNSVILEQWEEFRYRAVRIDVDKERLRPRRSLGGRPELSAREGARLRTRVLRDTMRMELPDRWTDLTYPPATYSATVATSPSTFGVYSVTDRVVPGKYNMLRRAMNLPAIPGGSYSGLINPIPSNVSPNVNHIAELLYQIVATSQYQGGSALEAFRPTEIGDTDNDGLPEFIDAWGTPIRWIRWPAGYQSPLNNIATPDAMDPLQTDPRWNDTNYAQKPWLLIPLIVSAGPDEEFDLQFDSLPSDPNGDVVYAANLDPYIGVDLSVTPPIGGLGSIYDIDGDDQHTDNITNYSLILD